MDSFNLNHKKLKRIYSLVLLLFFTLFIFHFFCFGFVHSSAPPCLDFIYEIVFLTSNFFRIYRRLSNLFFPSYSWLNSLNSDLFYYFMFPIIQISFSSFYNIWLEFSSTLHEHLLSSCLLFSVGSTLWNSLACWCILPMYNI